MALVEVIKSQTFAGIVGCSPLLILSTDTGSIKSEVFAAIVGALIGTIGTYLLTTWHERQRKQKEDWHTYMGWLNGLSAETEHISKCIAEISGYFNSMNQGGMCTKRMNHDFLEKARLVIFGYDQDVCFLETLTNAYRDVVHTNDMIERHERFVISGRHNSAQGIIGNVLKSMEGVDNSLNDLKSMIKEKLQIMQKGRG